MSNGATQTTNRKKPIKAKPERSVRSDKYWRPRPTYATLNTAMMIGRENSALREATHASSLNLGLSIMLTSIPPVPIATGDRVIYQRLGYLMRSGPPDSLDRLVANNFANLDRPRLV